jgi:hypothetical protein
MRQTKINEFLELEHHNKELEKRIKEEDCGCAKI